MLHRAALPVSMIHVINFDILVCAQEADDALQCTLHSSILGGHAVAMEKNWDS